MTSVKERKSSSSSAHNSTDDEDEEKNAKEVLTQVNRDQSGREETPDSRNQTRKSNVLEISQNNSSISSVKSIFNIEDITPDDEVYTLQCPGNFQMKDLYKKTLDFTDFKTTFTTGNEVFQVKLLNSDKEFITLALPSSELSSSLLMLPLEGHIVIHKDIYPAACKIKDEIDLKKQAVAYPNDIKVRHPLLGIDWKAHVELANAAFKKKKKKIKKERIEDSDELETKKIKLEIDELEFSSPKKKKKKMM